MPNSSTGKKHEFALIHWLDYKTWPNAVRLSRSVRVFSFAERLEVTKKHRFSYVESGAFSLSEQY
jgi:hypothetical protein